MKIPINLASQPFRRDRAMLVASIAVSVLLLATLGALISLIMTDRAQMADVRRDVSRLNRQVRQASGEQARLLAVLNKPENALVLYRTNFINELISRKGISWTRLLADLEKTLPYNVKVVQIRPSADAQNHVQLVMTLASQDVQPEIDALRALQASPLFGEVLEHSQIPPNPPGEPLYRYNVTVNYAPQF